MRIPEGLQPENFPIHYDPEFVPTTLEEEQEQEELRQMFNPPGLETLSDLAEDNPGSV